jgi:hypothetical protein
MAASDIYIPVIIKHVAHAILREVACFFLPVTGNRKHNYLPITKQTGVTAIVY